MSSETFCVFPKAKGKPGPRGTFLCTLPGVTTAMRLDVHFWWNLVEMLLLIGAGELFLRSHLSSFADQHEHGWRAPNTVAGGVQ